MRKTILPFLAFLTTATWAMDPPLPIFPETPVQKDGCYQISSASELLGFSELVNGGEANACGILTQDIVVNVNLVGEDGQIDYTKYHDAWLPIGNSSVPFAGTFDGAGHTISGLYYSGDESQNIGLFGYVQGSGADSIITIRNLGLEDSYFAGKAYVGNLVGYCARGTQLKIENSYSRSFTKIHDERGYAGGLVAYVASGATAYLTNSYYDGTIEGSHANYCGGGVGYAMGSLNFDNVFVSGYSATAGNSRSGVFSYDKEKFEDGTVAARLYTYMKNGVFGSIWGQDAVGGETYPRFSGSVVTEAVTMSPLTFHTYEGDPNAAKYPKQHQDGLSVALPSEDVMARDGYIFQGWYSDAKFSGSQLKTLPTRSGELHIYAKYVAARRVTYVEYDGKTSEGLYPNGSVLTLDTATRKGYIFAGWSNYKELKGDMLSSILVTMDTTLYAKWIEVKTPASAEGCYQISNANELYGFAALVNGGETKACGELTNDIVVNEKVLKNDGSLNNIGFATWTPIGTSSNRFAGSFDGKGHTVSGLYVNGNDWGVGLFGYVQNASASDSIVIQNVGVVNSYLKGNRYVSGIVGITGNNDKVTLSNCFSSNILSATAASSYLGGLVGYSSGELKIINSFSTDSLTVTNSYAGALVGCQFGGSLSFENSFYSNSKAGAVGGNKFDGAEEVAAKDFTNGSVAKQLFSYKDNGVDGTIWGQKEGTRHPDFCGYIENYKCIVNFHGRDASIGIDYFSIPFSLGMTVEYNGDMTAFERPATAKYSYTLKGWDRPFERIVECTAAAMNYYAVYDSTINKYTVAVNVNKSEAGSVEGAGTFDYGTEVTLTATAAEGYQFTDWADDVKEAATRKVVVTGDLEYTANFEAVSSSSEEPESSSSEETPESSSSEPESSSSEIAESSSSETVDSSSSEIAESSSSDESIDIPGSSSSEEVSSSSEKAESSSSSKKEESSSSSKKDESSSSSKKDDESSSSKGDAIVAMANVPTFHVVADGRVLRIAGADVDDAVALLDMQGRVMFRTRVSAASFSLNVPRAGSYLLRIGGQAKRVTVK